MSDGGTCLDKPRNAAKLRVRGQTHGIEYEGQIALASLLEKFPRFVIRYQPNWVGNPTLRLLRELKIGENVNATAAVLGGRIYIGAFNGNLYCLK